MWCFFFQKSHSKCKKKTPYCLKFPHFKPRSSNFWCFLSLHIPGPNSLNLVFFVFYTEKIEMYQPRVQQNLYPGHEVCVFSKKVIQNAKKNTLLFKIPTIQAQIFELLCFLNFHIPGTNSLNLVFFVFYTKKWKCISPGYSKTYTLG